MNPLEGIQRPSDRLFGRVWKAESGHSQRYSRPHPGPVTVTFHRKRDFADKSKLGVLKCIWFGELLGAGNTNLKKNLHTHSAFNLIHILVLGWSACALHGHPDLGKHKKYKKVAVSSAAKRRTKQGREGSPRTGASRNHPHTRAAPALP